MTSTKDPQPSAMSEEQYQDHLARHLRRHLAGSARLRVLGQPPASLVAACRGLLGDATVSLGVDPTALEQAPDVVVDAGLEPAEQRIELFESLVTGMAGGGHYVIFTGDPVSADTNLDLRRYFCDCMDDLHGFHKRGRKQDGFGVTALTPCIDSINFYPELVVIEILQREKPEMLYTGEPQF